MEYVYYLDGLGCANCAAKMEHAIGKHKDVTSANVVFMKKKLIVEPKETMTDKLLEEITQLVVGIESQVRVIPFDSHKEIESQQHQHEHHHEDGECCGHEHHHEDGECCGHEHGHEHHHEEEHGHSHGHSHAKSANPKIGAVCNALGIAAFFAALLLDKLDLATNWIFVPLYVAAYALVGYDVLWQSLKNIRRGQIFDEFFLMSVATVGALLIGEYPEAVAVMLFYKVGEFFQDKAVDQARGSIEALVNIKPDFANVVGKDGSIKKLNPSEVKIGDVIAVKAGERIPLDGTLVEGNSSLDMAALTGETKPVDVAVGDNLLSGSVNLSGYIKLEVTKSFGDSTVARIMDMVENAADKKSNAEQFITRFARVYTPIVCFLALALAILPPIVTGDAWSVWIYRALSFLVVSCPCALVISVPLGFFGGIGVASKNGILVKGGNYLEALADVSVIAFDKTGTLTKGSFYVSSTNVYQSNMEATRKKLEAENANNQIMALQDNELLVYLLSLAEMKSNHPIGKSIIAASKCPPEESMILKMEEIAGFGLVVDTIFGQVLAGNEKLMKRFDVSYEKQNSPATIVYAALDKKYIGAVIISDELKADTVAGIAKLAKEGITHTLLLSGDSEELVAEVAKQTGLEKAFGALLPGDKLDKIEQIYSENPEEKVAYVGDGINDAPVLARVDVGIAMGGVGQDAAIEAADMVLMTDEIGQIAKAVSIAKYTRQIVLENILLALGIKVIVLILIAVGYSSMWMAVFADVGVALLAVCNSIRVYRHDFSKKDN